MKIFSLFLGVLFISGCKTPQKTATDQAIILDKPLQSIHSLLWQISGNGLTKPSYLYGTIHIIGEGDYFLGKNVLKKLHKSEALVMELDLSKIDVNALTQISVLEKGKTVKDYMSDSDYALLRAFMEDSIGIKKFTFENLYSKLKPFYLEQLIFFRYLGQEKESYEDNFKKIAEEKNIPEEGLETFEEQLKFLEDIPLENQLKSLVKTIKNYTIEIQKLDQLIREYKAQDLPALTKSFEEDEDQVLKQKLVDKRNNSWVPKLKKFMQERSCFIAVGAGHLGGENGLIELLKKQGYVVEPISIDN
ncbi:MAG: TraB/GumN family protein [Bacteroidota bacterium]|nr:TraB/GumN family protein [Bacteroidota bacterium]